MKKRQAKIVGMLLLAMTQSACIVVGGYSSRGGWFLWPGSLGFIIILVLLYFLFGRRGR